MDYHKNARLTVSLRAELARRVVAERLTYKAAGLLFHVTAKTAAKWVRRYQEGGLTGLGDRSSRPHRCFRPTPSTLIGKVLALRQLRWSGWRIARKVKLSRATVSRILRRAGMNRLHSLDPPPPVVRYEHNRTDSLIHFDIKRLARIVKPGHRVHGDWKRKTVNAGYEYLHIVIDDHSRISFAAILPDQNHTSAICFFHMARAHFSRFGFGVTRVLTDNGPGYRDHRFAQTLRNACVRHRFTKPYTPRTNGNERFIQTALREWAYARTYQNSLEREHELDPWLHDYNFHRPMLASTSTPQLPDQG